MPVYKLKAVSFVDIVGLVEPTLLSYQLYRYVPLAKGVPPIPTATAKAERSEWHVLTLEETIACYGLDGAEITTVSLCKQLLSSITLTI